ncbi:hypothetical protein FACS1894191_0620 [Clostridia bacterium]|nr:hypothetical protein FACS1894191_0620 [Clostridia bacterium]
MAGIHHQRKKEQHELKTLLSEYGVLSVNQIYAYFHDKDREIIHGVISYMARNKLIVTCGGYAAITRARLEEGPDKKLVAAFWVMLDFIGTVEYHTPSEYPAQLYFFAEGTEYEVIYAGSGDENLMNGIFTRKEDMDTRYLVVVERP